MFRLKMPHVLFEDEGVHYLGLFERHCPQASST